MSLNLYLEAHAPPTNHAADSQHALLVDKIEAQSSGDSYGCAYLGTQTRFDWDHPLYWVAQMFEERWHAHPTYQRE